MGKTRTAPNVVLHADVRSQSSRNGAHPFLIVVHDTEGGTLESVRDLFDSRDASAHVCTSPEGNSARYVPDARKAWHCVSFNSVSLGVEQLGFAAFTRKRWLGRRAQLKETARWIARWSKAYGIPIRKGSPTRPGVVRHSDLGAAGGGHSDPGRGYPLALVLQMARVYRRRLS